MYICLTDPMNLSASAGNPRWASKDISCNRTYIFSITSGGEAVDFNRVFGV